MRLTRELDSPEVAGVERILGSIIVFLSLTRSTKLSYALYKAAIKNNTERLVILCDRSRILARSDQAETTPQTPL